MTEAELIELAERGAAELAGAGAEELLRWTDEHFGSNYVVASNMQDAVLVEMAAKVRPGVDVLFLDTGYHFAETIGTRDAFAASRPLNLINVLPVQTVAEQDAEYGEKLHDRDPGQCCALRKVAPMNQALEGFDAWVSGMRREDAPTRTDIGIIEYDAKRDMVKLNPMAGWTADDVAEYVATNHVLQNPLRQIGYTSIGCAPCTRPVAEGEDPRAGRWSGTNKTECGLHV